MPHAPTRGANIRLISVFTFAVRLRADRVLSRHVLLKLFGKESSDIHFTVIHVWVSH